MFQGGFDDNFSGYPKNWLSASRRWGAENNENSQNAQGRRLSLPQTKGNVWNRLRFLKKHFMFLEDLNRSILVNGMNSRLSCIYLFQNISRMPDHCHKTQRTSLSFRISRIYLVWLRPLFQGSLSPSHTLSSCNARCLPYPDKNTRKTPCFDSTLGKRTYKAFEWEAKFVWVMRGVLSEETIFGICTQRNFTKLHLTHEIFRILAVLSQFLWNLTFIFSDFHGKFSLVLLQMIYYIFSHWKM